MADCLPLHGFCKIGVGVLYRYSGRVSIRPELEEDDSFVRPWRHNRQGSHDYD